MAIVIILILVAIILFLAARNSPRPGAIRAAAGLSALLAIVFFGVKSTVIIDPGEVGIQVLFGQPSTDVLDNGLHVINPFMDVYHMDIRTQSYTMSGHTDEKGAADAITALSSDGLTLLLDCTALFHLLPSEAPAIYRTVGLDYVDRIVRPEIRTAIRDAAVSYVATDLYSTRREEFVAKIEKTVSLALTSRGLLLEKILVRNIVLPDRVRGAIDEKIAAEQEAQKMVYVLQKEHQEAERKRVEAGGISDAQRIIATSLTNQYLQWNYIQTLKELVNSNNSTFVITPYDSKLTPMLNVSNQPPHAPKK
jgi:regulator of protease activity HflC (stomatin/prohibitin superfamily)